MTKIKICGMTNPHDVKAAISAGADYIGMIFTLESKRFIPKDMAKRIVQAAPDFKNFVGVFRNQPKREIEQICEGLPIQTLQLHGDETPAFCNYFINRGFCVIKVFWVGDQIPLDLIQKHNKVHYILLDRYLEEKSGGTGKTFDWSLLSGVDLSRTFISGGLSAENVAGLIQTYHPFGVDIASSVERMVGYKDAAQMQQFIAAVRKAEA